MNESPDLSNTNSGGASEMSALLNQYHQRTGGQNLLDYIKQLKTK